MIAAFTGSPTLLKALLEKGADVNERMGPRSGAGGYTALVYAVFYSRNPEMVNILLAHGADVHTVLSDGRTPLSIARRLHHDQVAKMLKQAGEEE